MRSKKGSVRSVVEQSPWPISTSASPSCQASRSGWTTPARSASASAGNGPEERTDAAMLGLDEVDAHALRDDAGLEAAIEEELNGAPAALAHLDRHLVHPHPDEAIGDARVHAAREAHRVLERLRSMRERVLDRLAHEPGEPRRK